MAQPETISDVVRAMQADEAARAAVPAFIAKPATNRATGPGGKCCGNCIYWLPVDQRKGVGRCRRHAPTDQGHPVRMVDDWCGDHDLDESKVG